MMAAHLSHLLVLLLVLGLAAATTIDIDGVEEEDGEARTVFTSGGTYYIALNTTFLLYYSLLAGALLLAGLALSGAFSSAESTSGYGAQYAYQQEHQRAGPEEAYRNKRQAFTAGESKQPGRPVNPHILGNTQCARAIFHAVSVCVIARKREVASRADTLKFEIGSRLCVQCTPDRLMVSWAADALRLGHMHCSNSYTTLTLSCVSAVCACVPLKSA
jgi:hypothetical protein